MKRAVKHNRIDEELVCADALVHRLKATSHAIERIWRAETDPPDFWLRLANEIFAVEVTSVVDQQELEYDAACRSLERAAKETAKSVSSIKGTYALMVVRHPQLPKANSFGWRLLVAHICSFVQETETLTCTEQVVLLKDRHGYIAIEKMEGSSNTVGLVRAPGAKFEGEVQDGIARLMQQRIDAKRLKLENSEQVRTCAGIILAFYDAYAFGELDDAEKALLKVTDYEWLHSIFWVASFTDRPNEIYPGNPGRLGRFIYSRDNTFI